MSPANRLIVLAFLLSLGAAVGLAYAPAPLPEKRIEALPAKVQVGYPRYGGRLLKALRMIADTTLVSQARLAALSGVSATRISRAERGLDTLRTAEADALARVLVPMLRQRFGDDGLVWAAVVFTRNARTP